MLLLQYFERCGCTLDFKIQVILPLCWFSALPLLFFSIIISPSATSTMPPITLTLQLLFMLSSILLTVLLSLHFNLFCIYPYPSFISIASLFLFLFRLGPHFSTFHFIPISLGRPEFPCVCVCLCVWQQDACGYFSGSSPEDWTVIIYGPEL